MKTPKQVLIPSLVLLLFFTSCALQNEALLPTVSTDGISEVSHQSAIVSCTVQDDGNDQVGVRGICISETPNSAELNFNGQTCLIQGSGNGQYAVVLELLSANTSYYVRAYAGNNIGVSYGETLSFATGVPSSPGPILTDVEGNEYQTVQFGNGQLWMAENLRTSRYSNGDVIPEVVIDNNWHDLSTGAWSRYEHYSEYENIYGKLYNWYSVNDSRNVCPIDWHVPGKEEWMTLIDFLGGEGVAGGKIKTAGAEWTQPNEGATNESGFTGLPSGYRANWGSFYGLNTGGSWWSSSSAPPVNAFNQLAWFVRVGNLSQDVRVDYLDRTSGHAVRCLKD